MDKRISRFITILGFLFCFQGVASAESQALRVLLVTGGTPIRYHKIMVPTTLYTVLNEADGITWDHASLDEAAFENDIRDAYDIVVFFNRSDTLSSRAKENLKDFVESGKGIVVLHSGLSSYNDWDWWWREVVGGKYQLRNAGSIPASGFHQEERISFEVATDHPVTKAVGDFAITEEIYNRLNIQPGVRVLYKTSNAKSDGPVVWIGPHKKSRIIVLQPGHSAETYRNSHFRSLVLRSILWTGGWNQNLSGMRIHAMNANEKKAVEQVVIDAYIRGIHGNQDVKTVRNGFHEDFAMLVPEESGNIRKVSVDAWLDFIENTAKVQNPGLWSSDATYRFDCVDITDHVASVKIQVYRGEKHFSTDYMLLYRFDDGWKIVSKIFKLW